MKKELTVTAYGRGTIRFTAKVQSIRQAKVLAHSLIRLDSKIQVKVIDGLTELFFSDKSEYAFMKHSAHYIPTVARRKMKVIELIRK